MANQVNNDNTAIWMEKSKQAVRDLRIKKIFFAVICLLNLAGIISLLVYITMNYSLPTLRDAESLAPFVGGVLAALVILRIPTFGMNQTTFKNLTNLPLMVSQCVAFLFFGPTMVAKNCIDFTDYADPYEAQKIKNNFKKEKIIYLMGTYGGCLANLVKYGYLTNEQGDTLRTIYERIKDDIKTYNYLVAKHPDIAESDNYDPLLRARLNENQLWSDNIGAITAALPSPVLNSPEIPWYHAIVKCFSSRPSSVVEEKQNS